MHLHRSLFLVALATLANSRSSCNNRSRVSACTRAWQEAPKKEEKKEEKKPAEDAAAKAAKEAEKRKAKIIKEGGKKGVEIEGASELGGLDFFCTTVELPEGNVELVELSMLAGSPALDNSLTLRNQVRPADWSRPAKLVVPKVAFYPIQNKAQTLQIC